jgi:hypothetical protein
MRQTRITLKLACCASLISVAFSGCDYGPPTNTAPNAANATVPAPVAVPTTTTPSTPAAATEATPPVTTPTVPSAAVGTSFHANEEAVVELLMSVVDVPTAQAAAAPLRKLAEQQRPLIRPYWLWLVTQSNEQQNAYMLKRIEEGKKLRVKHGPGAIDKLAEIAKRPGSEDFKSALISLYQAHVDEAPRIHAANYQKLIDKLNQ